MKIGKVAKSVLFAAVSLSYLATAHAREAQQFENVPPEFYGTPEGVSVLGDIKNDRDTVIFVHGWSPKGEIGKFANQKGWNDSGFNTVVYRWHRDSYNPGPTPGAAEGRGWSSACPKGAPLISQFIKDLGPDYTGEIRLVGHSLGAGVATCLMHRLYEENGTKKPVRLELLDSFIQPFTQLPAGGEVSRFKAGTELYTVIESLLQGLRDDGVAIVNYSSITGAATSRDLDKVTHFQAMSGLWMNGSPGPRHNEIRVSYFNSIDEKRPLVSEDGSFAFSASTPTQDILNLPRQRLIQVGGEPTGTFSDDVFSRQRARD